MKKPTYITVSGATYNAEEVAKHGSFEAFRSQSVEQAAAAKNETLHFGAWGDQRDAKLQEVWDEATAAVKPATSTSAMTADLSASNPAGNGTVDGKEGKKKQ